MDFTEVDLTKDIIETYDEYVKLLEKGIDDLIGLAVAHGYTGNETDYHEGIRLRAKIQELKNAIEKEDEITGNGLVQNYLDSMELSSFKRHVIELLDDSYIEVLSYFSYPSCVRRVILSTNVNYKTPEHDWLTAFAEKMFYEVLPRYNIFIDNKIAIKIKPRNPNIKESEDNCSMWFGSKDGQYYIGLNAENMDGFPIRIANLKKRKELFEVDVENIENEGDYDNLQ